MNPAPFAYVAPDDLSEAIRLLVESDGEGRLLAGGQSLLPVMKLRFARPSLLVDLRRLRTQLSYVEDRGDTIAVGALTTHAEIERNDLLAARLPVLPRAAHHIADRLVRSLGTIGGSLCHVDPAGDWPAIALALEAQVLVAGPDGERALPVDELFVGPYMNSLGAGEVLLEVRFPVDGDLRACYLKQGRFGVSDFAVVGCCAATRRTAEAPTRVSFTGLSAVPHRDRPVEEALGVAPGSSRLEEAVALAGAEVEPLEDTFGSAEYRRNLARLLARRALEAVVA
jgi:carbon-monoxide dehydrogenase medium subunit